MKQSWLFENINKIDKPLSNLIKACMFCARIFYLTEVSAHSIVFSVPEILPSICFILLVRLTSEVTVYFPNFISRFSSICFYLLILLLFQVLNCFISFCCFCLVIDFFLKDLYYIHKGYLGLQLFCNSPGFLQ